MSSFIFVLLSGHDVDWKLTICAPQKNKSHTGMNHQNLHFFPI